MKSIFNELIEDNCCSPVVSFDAPIIGPDLTVSVNYVIREDGEDRTATAKFYQSHGCWFQTIGGWNANYSKQVIWPHLTERMTAEQIGLLDLATA